MDVVTRAAGDTIIITLIEQIDDVIHLDGRECLEAQLNRLKSFLIDISDQFQVEHRTLPEMVSNYLRRMQDEVGNARQLIIHSQWPQQFFDCLLCKPKLSGQIREWKTCFNKLFKELQTSLSVFYNGPQTVSSPLRTQNSEPSTSGSLAKAPNSGVREDTLQQQGKGKALVEDKFVGMGIKAVQMQLERWLTEAPRPRIIAVLGMSGIGKTTVLEMVYNKYKVSDIFDVVIWFTVGQGHSLEDLQNCIARRINLKLSIDNSFDMIKMKLLAYLNTKKFLLILDDLWSPLDLTELGVEFVNDKGSKVLLSTRHGDTIYKMDAAGSSITIKPLSVQEGWELFSNVAFKDGHVCEQISDAARELASECCGLPSAISVLAASMKDKTTVAEWIRALVQIRTSIRTIPAEFSGLENLYCIFKWVEDSLPEANLRDCFRYCAMFPKDEEIEVDKLVGMWIAEGFVQSKDPANLMDTAHDYIKLLVDRRLLKVIHIPHENSFLKIDSTLHGWTISTGKEEQHFAGISHLTIFPGTEIEQDCKRISYYGNNILSLPPNELKYPKLVSLILGANKRLEEVPPQFLVNFTCLRVLDLSRTAIKSLPTTLWQLIQLEYLDLSCTEIEDISENINNLCRLQFLNLSQCSKLKSLPQAICNLSELQFLDLSGCSKLHSVPSQIHEIKNLKYLRISQYSDMV